MPTWEQEIPIIENNAKKSLEVVLAQIVLSNDSCSVLVSFKYKGLGTAAASVVLEWNDDHCSTTN